MRVNRTAGTYEEADRQASSKRQLDPPKLDLIRLRTTPGFLIRMAQLKFFEGFYQSFATLGLSPASYAVLTATEDNPGIALSSLAGLLQLRPPNLTKLLNRLESEKLVMRRRSKSDGREIEVFLTAHGTRIINEAWSITADYNRRMLAPLNETEQSKLVELLDRIVAL